MADNVLAKLYILDEKIARYDSLLAHWRRCLSSPNLTEEDAVGLQKVYERDLTERGKLTGYRLGIERGLMAEIEASQPAPRKTDKSNLATNCGLPRDSDPSLSGITYDEPTAGKTDKRDLTTDTAGLGE